MKRVLIVLSAVVCVAFIYPLVGSSCSRDGFKEITISNELGSYSFEYPAYYKKNVRDNFDFDVP